MTAETLSPSETDDLRRIAALMLPASAEYNVPAADDPAIFADIVKSLGRDFAEVQAALAELAGIAGRDDASAEAAAKALLAREDSRSAALGRSLLQCYYRDDRVVRSLGLEPRPPFPKGHELEQGDWSLLDPVRARPKMWRDA
jgi:hypothetical protein